MVAKLVTRPASLQWWEWGKVVGAVAIVLLIASGAASSPVAVAIALHLFCDFTVQDSETATRKAERGWRLVVHSLAAGALPLAVAGAVVGPSMVIVGALTGFVSHFAIDWTRKFGVKSWQVGISLDQVAHLAIIVLLF